MIGNDLRNDLNRGQTPQDFAVGISIFLLTVMFVFAFVPSVLQPSRAGEEVTLTTEGDRVASALVTHLSKPGRPNHLNASAVNATVNMYDDEENVSKFRSEYGLGNLTNVNVTIRTLNDSGPVKNNATNPYRFGDEYRDQQVVEVRRMVTMDDDQCQEGCLLIVRIW